MSMIHNLTIEQLAEAFQKLSISERAKLVDLLPENWFENSNELSEIQKQALDYASEKEDEGRAVFHTWEDVENYVKNRT
ncbi:hypothetical protein EI546_11810 [Aequorivita sp. H23M31]|uniref:Addiction module protein n=1 Tax=Aequorivita ciconiae TaxID=2494375 RepID=A0A410G532_9FLAO|nr:hypothetical protein [Aequorivita sp. H23M31]QAA82360.1 hypothetical protein EI546_11810 [Aequorivita sp. H23M31]